MSDVEELKRLKALKAAFEEQLVVNPETYGELKYNAGTKQCIMIISNLIDNMESALKEVDYE